MTNEELAREAATEVFAKLRSRVSADDGAGIHLHNIVTEATLNAITRAQSEDKADAERYRFLRDQSDPDEQQPYIAQEQLNSWGKWLTVDLTPTEADSLINQVIAARTQERE